MFGCLEMHVVEPVATLAVKVVVVRIKIRIVAYRSESFDRLQKFGSYQFR